MYYIRNNATFSDWFTDSFAEAKMYANLVDYTVINRNTLQYIV